MTFIDLGGGALLQQVVYLSCLVYLWSLGFRDLLRKKGWQMEKLKRKEWVSKRSFAKTNKNAT